MTEGTDKEIGRGGGDLVWSDDRNESNKRFKVLEDQIQNLTKVLEGGGKCSSGTKKGVEIEGVPFNDEQDLKVWVEQELPSSFPFGCFVDIYSFLDRILQTSGG